MSHETALQTITVSGVPKPLLAELEKLAERERRNRSNYIVKTLLKAVGKAHPVKRPRSKAA